MKDNTSIGFHSSIVASQSFQRHTSVELQPAAARVSVVCRKYFSLWWMMCGMTVVLLSCSVSKQINKQAVAVLLNDSVISTGHIGISLYEPASGKYWYNHDATKNFVPASNVKLFSLYAGMKYLGDSLIGIRYERTTDGVNIYPTGDPSFLHPDFKQQPVFDFLKNTVHLHYVAAHFTEALGAGWAWDDYNDDYMVQRSEFPVYGNLIRIWYNNNVLTTVPARVTLQQNEAQHYGDSTTFSFVRKWDNNDITAAVTSQHTVKKMYEVPMTAEQNKVIEFLADTLHQSIIVTDSGEIISHSNSAKLQIIHSQPVDSLFTPMMHNSDNFFAEQTLLMASNEHLGFMSDEAMIDRLLKTDLKDIPQQPSWVDGSGLSRYNLFSPQAMVYIIHKMQAEFGVARLKTILPTGGTGTLKNYYLKDSGYLFAKTGSLGNCVALSGFLYTKKGRQIIFSVLANNFQGPAYKVRRAAEKFLENIRERY